MVREAIWTSIVEVEVDHLVPPESLTVDMSLVRARELDVLAVTATDSVIRRTPSLARTGAEPAVFVGFQLSGSSIVVQDDRQTVLQPGDFALYDTTRPYDLVFEHGLNQIFLRIPRSSLALPRQTLQSVTAMSLASTSPISAVTGAVIRQLAHAAEWTAEDRAALAPAMINLVRATALTLSRGSADAKEPTHATLSVQVLTYLGANLGRADLTAGEVAAAHHISVRHLYNILGEAGISLGDWLRSQRLEHCKSDLRDPTLSSLPVSAIAFRWGFTNASHFSRLFRRVYGMTASDYRRGRSDVFAHSAVASVTPRTIPT